MKESLIAKRGIIIVATGHPYYGRMAYNLALSVKAVDNQFPVAVVHSENSLSHLSNRQKRFFDDFILLPEATAKGFASKLHLDTLSPFQETLFTDADTAWLPHNKPDKLFDELTDVEYTGITEGYYDIETENDKNKSLKYYFWANPKEIKDTYDLKTGKLYQWRSEVIYFKNTERVREMFKMAREIVTNHGLKSIMLFGHQVPDELGINISTAKLGIDPHKYKWLPALWPRLHGTGNQSLSDIYMNYYLLSCGSNYSTPDVRVLYDRIIKAAHHKMGMDYVFPLISKKEFLPERQKM